MFGYGRAVLIVFSLLSLVFTGQQAQSKETPTTRFRDRVPSPPLVGCSPTAVSVPISGGSYPEDKTDLQQAARFCRAINDLLQLEQFEKLDQIADRARYEKSRFAGGGWKLFSFYGRVTYENSNPSESEWEAQFATLNRWLTARPHSVAARIALATLYEKYSYFVTGSGSGPEVEASMRKTFQDRLKHARDLLDQARTLNSKDPQIDLVLLRIARSQAWGSPAINQLFEQAIAAEPGYYYYYYYLDHVDTLRGDSVDGGPVGFAKTSADRIGGADGDILYFHIAHEFGFYNPQYLKEMSWPRIVRGYSALEAEFGVSWMKLNWICQLAIYRDEMQYAAGLFDRIGKNWDEETWGYLYNFEAYRGIAQTVRALDGPERSKTPRLKKYNDTVAELFHQKYSNTLKQCTVRAENPVPPSFHVYLQIEANGSETGSAFLSSHEMPHCLDIALQSARFPAPPNDLLGQEETAIWVRIPIHGDHPNKPDLPSSR